MKIALSQPKLRSSDLRGNLDQIVEDLNKVIEHNKKSSDNDKVSFIVYPETAITGYACGANFQITEFVQQNETILNDIIAPQVQGDDLVALVPYVRVIQTHENEEPQIANSVAVIQNGEVVGTYDKILMADEGHHEDSHYFTPGEEAKVFKVNIRGKDVTFGTPICQDTWNHDIQRGDDNPRDIVAEMISNGAELILSTHQSYFYVGKQNMRRSMFSAHAKNHKVPVIAVNAVGMGDFLKNYFAYDGGSMAFNAQGEQIAELTRFARDFKVIDTQKETITPPFYGDWRREVDLAVSFAAEELLDILANQTNGVINTAQVHKSGGLDSEIMAFQLYKALGRDRLVFISNPTKMNGEELKGIAQTSSDMLGMKLYWNETESAVQGFIESHKKAYGSDPTPTEITPFEAVGRFAQGLSSSHKFKSVIFPTGNHSENELGWFTFGDVGSHGLIQLFGDLPKGHAYKYAAYLNSVYRDLTYRGTEDIIAPQLYDGSLEPSAELRDSSSDPWDYHVASGITCEFRRNQRSPQEVIAAYDNKTLDPLYFLPDAQGKSIYEHIQRDDFEKEVWREFYKIQSQVWKVEQAAPSLILFPRAKGGSAREPKINLWNPKEFYEGEQ